VRSVSIAILLLLFALTAAEAADIDVKRLEGGSTLVVVEGKLEFGDIETFRAKVAALPAGGTTVAFQSKGGRLLAGIRIGTVIRSKKFATVVPDAAECASACALAWLGGTRRFAGKDAKIGFHAAYVIREGAPTESGPGNAIVGAYLNQLGLSEKAILYVTQAVPTSMQWMTMQDAAEYGIAVAPLSPPPHSASAGAAASDYPKGSSERLAIDFVLALVTRWSGPNAELMPFLDQSYADKVLYFGKPTPRQTVLREKRRLAERWNQRAYTVRPGSLSAMCTGRDGTCRVKGVMSWKLTNHETSARGSTSFEYSVINVIDEHEPLRIAAETTSAKDRRPAALTPLTLVGQGLQKLVSPLRATSKSANTVSRPKAPVVR